MVFVRAIVASVLLVLVVGTVVADKGMYDKELYDRIEHSVAKNAQAYPNIDRNEVVQQPYHNLLRVKRSGARAAALIEIRRNGDAGHGRLSGSTNLKRAAALPLPNALSMGGDEPEGMEAWDPSLGQAVGGAPDCNGEGQTWLTGCARKSKNAISGMGGMRDGWMNPNGACDALLSNFGTSCVFGST